MLSARKTMDVVAAYRDVGTYRGAAEICGVDPKTVKRKVLAHEAGELDEGRVGQAPVPKNTDVARALVAQRVEVVPAGSGLDQGGQALHDLDPYPYLVRAVHHEVGFHRVGSARPR